MSGHSKWATTHRQKEVNDAARGRLFSKLSRAITIAARTGGGTDPESNYKLRIAIDKARAASMPKDNVERALSKASEAGEMIEATYEGFGPGGVGVIVEVVTDNKNRSSSEIKNIFEKSGGRLGGPGSVSYNFEPKGLIEAVVDPAKKEQTMLSLIDLGAEDMDDVGEMIEIYTSVDNLADLSEKLASAGIDVRATELTQKPKNLVTINDTELSNKITNFLESLSEHDDVQKVYANADLIAS